MNPAGTQALVTCLWSRKLDVIDLSSLSAAQPAMTAVRSISLPWNPREVVWLPTENRAVVADAFGGGLALVDVSSGQIDAQLELAIHNLRGIALNREGERLAIAAMTQYPGMPLELSQGRYVRWKELFHTEMQPNKVGESGSFHDPRHGLSFRTYSDHGLGDPTATVQLQNGEFITLFGGASTFLQSRRAESFGIRPVAIAIDAAQRWAYVVTMLDDTVWALDPQRKQKGVIIPLGPMPAATPADRGEQLFYDSRDSRGSWMSCHSCHTDGHTSGILADTSADGSFGAPKRTPTLLGTRLTDRWTWNGEVKDLSEQVEKSLRTTLHAQHVRAEQVADLTAFLHTLPPPPPLLPPQEDNPADLAQIARGKTLFEREDCGRCHVPPLTYTSQETYDVGLADEKGNRKFNPPSLRGVSQGYRFFHDGRAKTLESVFTDHHHPPGSSLTKTEIADLVRFLQSL